MNILITGGTGFIGGNLASFLLDKGFKVYVLARHKKDPKLPGSEFIQGDILDFDNLNSVLKDKEIVYHLAAATDERLSYDTLYRINVIGTKNILEACLRNKIKHLIFTSTIGVLGPTDSKGANETHPYNPQTPYEKTKCEAEKLVLDYHKKFGLPVTVLRPTMVYGPEERWLKVFNQAEKGIPVIGDGANFWHLVYIKDVVEALFLAMDKNNTFGEVYHIADSSPCTYKEVYDTLRWCLGLPPINKHIPVWTANIFAFFNEVYGKITKENPIVTRPHIKRLIRQRIVDISKAKKELGFRPRYSIKEGFQETVGSFKKTKTSLIKRQ